IEHLTELRDRAKSFDLNYFTLFNHHRSISTRREIEQLGQARVLFLPSIPSWLRNILLREASFLFYTAPGEHFGLVPVEAMICGTLVMALNVPGGPLE